LDRFRVAIVIPAFNEEDTLAPVVSEASKYGTVIVVDDCSCDATAVIAKNKGALVLRNEENEGYEYSLNRGFSHAISLGVEAVIMMDADGEHDPADLPLFIHALLAQKSPLVLGVRARKQRLAETIMGWYVRAIHGPMDILCGFKGYARAVIEGENSDSVASGIGTSTVIKCLRKGYQFREVHITVKSRTGAPRFGSSLGSNIRILKVLARLVVEDGKALISTLRSKS
jgi:glycosyltransferase involved in cell wall biosynthesis